MPGRAEILTSLLDAITEVQVISGRLPDAVDPSTELFGGIDGFDSLNALEMLVTVSARVDNELPDQLLDRNGDGSPLTVGDLAGRILTRLEGHYGDS